MATEKSKEILQYREQGLGYKKIAVLTGYSLNTVKSVCRRNPNGEEKLCLQCGAKLVRTPLAYPESVKRKAIYHFTCVHCGQPFDSYGNDHRKYCSRACYAEARRKGV